MPAVQLPLFRGPVGSPAPARVVGRWASTSVASPYAQAWGCVGRIPWSEFGHSTTRSLLVPCRAPIGCWVVPNRVLHHWVFFIGSVRARLERTTGSEWEGPFALVPLHCL